MSEKPSWIHYKCVFVYRFIHKYMYNEPGRWSRLPQQRNSKKKDGPNVNMFLTFLFSYKVKFFFKDLYELLCSKENCDIMQRKRKKARWYTRPPLDDGKKKRCLKSQEIRALCDKTQAKNHHAFPNYRHIQYFNMIYNLLQTLSGEKCGIFCMIRLLCLPL